MTERKTSERVNGVSKGLRGPSTFGQRASRKTGRQVSIRPTFFFFVFLADIERLSLVQLCLCLALIQPSLPLLFNQVARRQKSKKRALTLNEHTSTQRLTVFIFFLAFFSSSCRSSSMSFELQSYQSKEAFERATGPNLDPFVV